MIPRSSKSLFNVISVTLPVLDVLSNRLAGRKSFSEEASCGPARLLAGKIISSEDDPLMKFFETSKYIPARLTFFIIDEKCNDLDLARILAENIFSEVVLAGNFKLAR